MLYVAKRAKEDMPIKNRSHTERPDAAVAHGYLGPRRMDARSGL